VHKGQAVVTVGETMAMFRAVTSAPIAPDSLFDFGIGGAESNVAIGLTRLGVPSVWMSALGNDDFGAVIRQTLEAEGVSVIAEVSPDRPTGLMVKIPVDEEDPRVRYYRAGSAAAGLTLGDKEWAELAQARWIHLSGILPALSETARDTAHAIVDFALTHGIPYSLDINFRPQLWSKTQARSTLLGLACDATIVFGGRPELEILVGAFDSDTELLAALADCGPQEVVVKLGAHGAAARYEGRDYSTGALPVEVVDTVGAGDAFVAGYLSQRLAGESPAQALTRGAVCGALVCTKTGDWEGAPYLEEVTSFETGVLV
jgi:2-dehydro-3-deoxygluconokinase